MSNGWIVHCKTHAVIVTLIVVCCGEEIVNHNCGYSHHNKTVHHAMNVYKKSVLSDE